MKKYYSFVLLAVLFHLSSSIWAQTPVYPNPLTGICDAAVPHFNVNLTGVPDSVWVSPNVMRQPTCCGDPGTGNWTFVSFTVTLDPNVAEVAVGLAPSDPGGNSSGYWIDSCGTWGDRIEGGTEVCITGPGPHNFWYGKSGGNANSAYTIVQIPKPTFPADDSVRIGCSLPLDIYGLNNVTMTSGNATYDSWLDMTDPSHPIFTPGSTAPAFIDFTITGNQIASATCGNYVTTHVVRIYIYQPLDISVSPDPANFCEGGNVTLSVSVANPVGTLQYSWINNQTNIEISTASTTPPISAAGNYTVYVSDVLNRYGCAPVGITQYVEETLAPVITASNDDTVCTTNPVAYPSATLLNPGTGVLWTSPNGGTFDDPTSLFPEYTASATDLANGFVDLTVTAFGCQDDSDVVRIYFDNGPVYTVVTPAILCHDSTVVVSVNITSGGTSPWTPISYYWSVNGTSGPSSIELGAGTYSVTVVNNYGCGSNTPFTLTEPNALTIVMSSTDATPTGTATATVGGGTPGYTYSWENSLGNPMGTTSTISGLSTDYYVATVTDNNGCIISGSTVVNDPSCSGFDATALGTDALCFESKDGSATVTSVVNGSGNYDYLWLTTPSQNTITATGLGAGVYEVVVTDLTLGCRDIAIAVVNEPTQVTNTMTHTDNTVIGGTAGTATANPAGGTPGYSYSWNTAPIQITQTATGLAAGLYTVTITDINSCSITDNVLINEPPCNNFQAAVTTTDISCNGLTDGSAQVIVAHGSAPYSYSLDGGAYLPNPSGNFTGLTGGAHTLSIMDLQKCVVIQNFFIDEPSALSIGLTPNNIICYGQTNGTIDLSITGGTYPYTFEWINNNGNLQFAITEDVIELGVGTYSVTVTDANGCTAQASAGIDQPSDLSASYVITDISCFGADNGAIDATVSGGQTPYTYSWIFPSGTASTQDLSGLSPGQYLLSVTDANNCVKNNVVNIYMNEPQQVAIYSTIVNCPSPGATTTLVEVDSISGGTDGPYQLSFDGGASLPAGVYSTSLTIGATHTVTATDANGCTVIAPTSIVINPSVVISDISFNPCIPVGAATIPVTVTPSGGDGGPYEVSTNGGGSFNAAGTYTINYPVGSADNFIIKDTSGCRSLPVLVSIPNEISVSSVVDSVACLNGNDGSILLSVSGGTNPYNVSWTGPLSGNPAGIEILFLGGTYTITALTAGTYSVTITDANSCTKVVSVVVGTTVDLIDPVISCSGNITTNTDLNSCFANEIYGTPVGTDNCPGSITTQTAGLASGSNFPVGTTTNTFLVTDAQGRTATCSFNITVIDAQLPTVTCPANISVNTDPNQCTASVLSPDPVTSDNCSVTKLTWTATGATTLSSPATGINTVGTQVFNKGVTTVNYVVTDAAGNFSSCSYTVTVSDNESPVVICPSDISTSNDNGFCTASINYMVSFSDNCSGSTLMQTAGLSSGSAFPVGTTTNQFSVVDASGNGSVCSFNVTVIDTTAPVINCISDIMVDNSPGICETTVTFVPATAQAGCGADCVTTLPTTAGTYLGSFNGHHYVLSASNADWNTANATANGLGGQLVSINSASENNFLTSVLSAGSAWTGGFQSPANPGFSEPAGGWAWLDGNLLTYLNWNIGEPNEGGIGNEHNIQFLSGSGVWNDYNGIFSLPFITEFSCPVMVVQTAGLPSGSNFPVGTTQVSFTAYNANGGSSTCSFDVIVNDIDNPTVTCPSDVTVSADAGNCFIDSANANLGSPVVADNCGVATIVNDAPATFPVGITTVTWIITDVNGNFSTCEQDVTVTDDENPVITTCPATVNVNADNGTCFATNVNLGTPVVSDNCGIATIINDAPGAFAVGTTTVTWTVTDIHGNQITCMQTVTVTDNQNPVIVCPSNITQNNDPAVCGSNTVSLGTPFTSDNCGVNTITNNAPAFFPVGTTTVTWIVTDVNGNSAQCDQTVIIIDNELPVVITCPADINTTADAGNCFIDSANVNLGSPAVTDNCGIASIVNNAPATFTVGTTTVTWTIMDVNGNISTCQQDITVTDDENPVITTCPATVNVNADNGSCFATNVNLGIPVASDNCGIATVTNDAPGAFPVGATTVTWTVTDIHGNLITCTQTVNVTDTQLPVIICAADVTQSNDNGACGSASVSLTNPFVSDNCGIATLTNDAPAFFPVGITTVTWTATDVNGNSAQCTQNVSITDDENPVIVSCVIDQIVIADASCEFVLADYTTSVVATDNCGYTITQSPIAGTVITTGITNVVITVTDNAGNSVSCNFDMTVEDTLSPVISGCPPNISVNTDAGICGAVVNWTVPAASDNCGVNLTSTHNAGDLFPVGTTTVTYTAIDPTGNTTLCSFDVTVTDNELPTILTCQPNIGSCDSLVTFAAPTATDNCGVDSIVQTAGLPSGSVFPVGTTTIVYTITDVHGNTSACSFEVTIHPTPVLSMATQNISCFEFENGMIDLTVTSGTSPFTYQWSDGSTNEDIDSLAPGNYLVTVTDTFGCQASMDTVITQPEILSMFETHVAADCNGNNSGAIDLTVYGGTSPYTYDWSNNETSEDIDSLFSGNYVVVVADANGCTDSLNVVITEPAALFVTAQMSPATCSGSDGELDITVGGGTAPYTYNWTGGITTEDLTGASGNYSVTVMDDNGCTIIYTDSISSESYISVIDKITDVTCFGTTTGLIDLLVVDGTAPYTFNWSTGDTTEDISNLPAGVYSVQVTDSNLCTVNLNYIINEPDSLVVSLSSPVDANGYNISYYGGNNGEIEMVVSGGTLPYNIVWVETGDTTANIGGLTAGTYNAVVTDANGCSVVEKIILTEPFELAMPTGYSPNGDGANDYFVVKGIEAYPDNQIQVYNRWGNIVYQESGYHNMWNGTNSGGDELPDGTYFVVLILNGTDIEPLTGYVDLRRTR